MELNSYRLRKWRNYVIIRDGFICQHCLNKFPSRELHAHHIYLKSLEPDIAYNLDNGITACRRCHLSVIHSDDRNESRFRIHFKCHMRRKGIKGFNDKYQDRVMPYVERK